MGTKRMPIGRSYRGRTQGIRRNSIPHAVRTQQGAFLTRGNPGENRDRKQQLRVGINEVPLSG